MSKKPDIESSSSSNPTKTPEKPTPPRTSTTPPRPRHPHAPPPNPPPATPRRGGEGGSASAGINPPNRDQRLALIPVRGSGIEIGGRASGSSGTVGVPEQAGHPQSHKRKVSEVVVPEGVTPTCSVCGRRFGSWKALFGHMRSHPNRTWRGVFPPPGALAPARPVQGQGSSVGGERAVGLDFDLNEPRVESSVSGEASEKKVDGDIDLNKPPAKEDSE